jgi:hypothetical protein
VNKKIDAKRTIMVLALALSGITLLSGCGITSLVPLPDEERYQYINEVVDIVEPTSSGEVIKNGKDAGDGVFSPSSRWLILAGIEPFDVLSERIQKIPNIDCQYLGKEEIRCRYGRTDVSVTKNFPNEGETYFKVLDTSNGRDSQ